MIDAISGHVARLGAPPQSDGAAPKPAAADEATRTLRPDVGEMDSLLDGLNEVAVQLAPLRRSIAALERARRLGELISEQVAPRRTRHGDLAKTRSLADEMRGLVEAVERDLVSTVQQVDRELQQVRQTAEHLRLLPASTVFPVLERTVRDSARAVGVRAALETRGGEIRLDAHVLSLVQQALVQVIRNAIAHGIEPEIERRAAQKAAIGRISLDVSRRGNRVVFACRDDGRGVDLAAVRSAAERRGVPSAELRRLAGDEVVNLLLRAGISTTDTVTEVAGRGVGLDVVREAADRLGGEVTVRSDPGRGFAIELVVPLSLAALEAVLVEAGGQTAAIPLDSIRRTLRVDPGDVAHGADGASIVYNGAAIPYIPLARALCADPAAIAAGGSSIVIASGDRLAAVGVDGLRGTQTVVVRPLPAFTPADAVVAGASLDGQGNPQLVLDPDALVASASAARSMPAKAAPTRYRILVIDDSLTTRMLEQSILESAGYIVETASSGEDGLVKARRGRFALFLVDVEMPGMDGFTFIETARADPALRDVPAVLVTSRASPEDKHRGVQVGARAHIVKNEFDQTELLEKIRFLIGAR
jgi:two-component system chemotaxis sensor kinase CheA